MALLAFSEPPTQEVGIHWWHPVFELQLWGTADDGPPPLLSNTGWGLHRRRPRHCHWASKGVRPQAATHCVKDTKEEEDSSCLFWHWSPIIGGLCLVRSNSSYLFGIGQSMLVDFGLYAPNRLVFFDMSCLFHIGQSLLVDFDLRVSTHLVFLSLVSHCWWTLVCALPLVLSLWHWSATVGRLWLVRSHSSCLFDIGQSLLVDFDLCVPNRLVFVMTRLNNTSTPVYLGVHLDRTVSFKTHIQKTEMKVNARNNIICKLANSKWGCRASTLRSSCLALCYSAAEYACPVWERSTHASKLNAALHDCCRIISGCLKPANVDSVHLLAGIAPPQIRRTVASRMERSWLTTDIRHQLFNHMPAASRLKSRKSFMHTMTPLDSSPSITRIQMWNSKIADIPASNKMGLEAAESLPAGSDQAWLCWRSLNRLRRRWGYIDDTQSLNCNCGELQTMAHLLCCRILDEACTAEDLVTVIERAKACARKWQHIVWRTRKKKKTRLVFFDIDHLLLVDFALCAPTRLIFLVLVNQCWWTLACTLPIVLSFLTCLVFFILVSHCWWTLICAFPLILSFCHWSATVGGHWFVRSHSSYLYDIGQPLLADFDLCVPTHLVFLILVSHCWWTLTCAFPLVLSYWHWTYNT